MSGKRVWAIPAVGLVVLVAWWALRPRGDAEGVVIASGTVEATEADLGFQVAGRLATIHPQEGQRVRRGDTLATLDHAELRARRQQMEAEVDAQRARLSELERGFRQEEIAQAHARVRAAEQRMANAQRDRERARHLFEGGAISRQTLDHRETAADVSEAELETGREALALLQAGPRPEQVTAQRAALSQARAGLAQIDATISFATIIAPWDGVITIRHREPGEALGGGSPALTLMNPDDRWVRIYIREDALGAVALGQSAVITADTYRDREYAGEVAFIASQAEFTPRNVQTTEERVKLVYEVKVRISGDPSFDLKPGLAADVYLAGNNGGVSPR